jgi:hypothetical protein
MTPKPPPRGDQPDEKILFRKAEREAKAARSSLEYCSPTSTSTNTSSGVITPLDKGSKFSSTHTSSADFSSVPPKRSETMVERLPSNVPDSSHERSWSPSCYGLDEVTESSPPDSRMLSRHTCGWNLPLEGTLCLFHLRRKISIIMTCQPW